MRTILLLGIVSVVAVQPALAQDREPYGAPYVDRYRSAPPRQTIDQLARRVDNGLRFGMIAREEAQQLRAEVERLRRLEYQYGHDGFSSWERSNLARQIDRLRSDVLAAEQRRFGRSVIVPPPNPYYEGDRQYRWDDPRDDDRGRGDDRDDDSNYDRSDDRDDDSRYGGSSYERDDDSRYDGNRDERDENIIYEGSNDDARDRISGRGDDGAEGEPGGGYPEELRVGDPAPVNLGLLPPELRTRFRDGNGVYYRYWNGTVYQIDSRTDVIRWIGPARN